jgi:uncharacterized protein YndB with AHSA1/START domain
MDAIETPSNPTSVADELIITHVAAAPRELVFQAWTEADRLAQWWGPAGMELVSCEIELRPDGLFHYGTEIPNGSTMWGRWLFQEITAPERLTYVFSFSDEQGGVTRAPFSADWPLHVFSTVELADADGKTRITMRALPVDASDAERAVFAGMVEGMKQGWAGTLGQLDSYLATAQG